MQKMEAATQQRHRVYLSTLIHRTSGERVSAIITRLWFDGCEITTHDLFADSEHIEIEFDMMGRVRSRVTGSANLVLSVRFLEECPV